MLPMIGFAHCQKHFTPLPSRICKSKEKVLRTRETIFRKNMFILAEKIIKISGEKVRKYLEGHSQVNNNVVRDFFLN
jgi:hypothetical protein